MAYIVLEGGFGFAEDRFVDERFTLESSGNIYKHVSEGKRREMRSPTLEDEGIFRVPEVLKRQRFITKLEKHPTGIAISEYVYRTLVIFRCPLVERTPIFSRRFREICVEVGFLRETETSLVLSFKMTKVPKNLW